MPSSSGSTCGPHSLISVYELAVGSTTAVEVRDSSAMRTKSLRIASSVSCSTRRVPVRPPASPVATTGTSSRFSARATLIPLPPARVSPPLARCRWPRWKLGTVSVRSRAALSVTVTIMASASRNPSPHVVRRSLEIPARATGNAGLVDRTGGDDLEARESPRHERGEVVVADPPRGAAEDRRVDGDPRAADSAYLGPAGRSRVPRLHADHARIGAEQVVPCVQPPIAFDRRIAHR